MRRAILLIILLCISLPLFAIDTRAVDRLMERAIKSWQIPGAAVAIVQNDRLVYVKGYGSKYADRLDPVTEDTLFGVGSTTKAFTTATMAILVDEKKMDWDDPVRKHLPWFHLDDGCADSLVTLRDIVSHRTGLTRHDELWDNSPWGREEVIRRVGSMKLTRPFRTAYQYQNIMFVAAGEAVAAAAKKPWNDFVRERIFQPLGMTHTVIAMNDFEAADHAMGHRYDPRTGLTIAQRQFDDDNIAPAGAIKSSARDMAQWIRLQLNEGSIDEKQILSQSALHETKMPQTVIRLEDSAKDNNPESNLEAYGLGWVVQDYRGALLVSHAGALNGFRTHVDLLPQQNAGFVVLLNGGRGFAAISLRNSLADLLLGSKPSRDWDAYYLDLDRKSFEKGETRRKEREAKRRPDAKPSHALEDYAGNYQNAGYGDAEVRVENGLLVLHWNRLTLPLVHFAYDIFSAVSEEDDIDETVVFTLDESGNVAKMKIFGEEFGARR